MTAQDYVNGLRQIADWFEAHPDMPVPFTSDITIYNAPSAVDAVKALGSCRKRYDDYSLLIERDFPGVKLQFYFLRGAVCKMRVVGTEEVPERVVPATVRQIVEWDCDPLLGEGAAS